MNIDTCTMLIQYQYYVDTIWYWYSFNTMHGLYDTDGRAGTTGRRSPHRWPLMKSWTSSLSVISQRLRGRRRRVTPITWWGSSSTTGGASGVVTTPLAAGTLRLVSQKINKCLFTVDQTILPKMSLNLSFHPWIKSYPNHSFIHQDRVAKKLIYFNRWLT